MVFFRVLKSLSKFLRYQIVYSLKAQIRASLIPSSKKKIRFKMLEAHILAMLVLGVSSFIIGSIPLKLRWTRQPLALSLLLCLGGGILLATSLSHMLAEVREKLPNYAEIIFCSGFLFLYAVDELIHLCVQDVHSSCHSSRDESRRSSKTSISSTSDGLKSIFHKQSTNYGTIDKLPTRARFDSVSKSFQDERLPADYIPVGDLGDNEPSLHRCCRKHEKELSFQRAVWKETADTELTSDSSESLREICHNVVPKPCAQSKSSLLGLLAALLIHAILEGCSIGVQEESTEVLLVLAAVASHKLVLAFCLGMELATAGFDGFRFIISLTAFSIGCPIGIAMGASITHTSDGVLLIEAPLQALAGGSLLYVAVFEILPRERYKWQHNLRNRYATFLQMLSVILGFSIIILLNCFLGYHEHDPHPAKTTIPP